MCWFMRVVPTWLVGARRVYHHLFQFLMGMGWGSSPFSFGSFDHIVIMSEDGSISAGFTACITNALDVTVVVTPLTL